MLKGVYSFKVMSLGLLLGLGVSVPVYADTAATWSNTANVTYDLTNPGTILMYKNELSQGGMNLTTKSFVDGKSETADLVFDGSGSTIGAIGVYDEGKVDFNSVAEVPDNGYSTEASVEAGHTYIIMTHDGSFAKIGITSIVGSRLAFKFALQTESANNNGSGAADAGSSGNSVSSGTSLSGTNLNTDTNNTINNNGNSNSGNAKNNTNSNNESDSTDTNTTTNNSITLTLGSPNVSINGSMKTLDVAPMLDGNYTLVPFRFIGEALGAKVEWRGEDRSVALTLNGKSVRLSIDSQIAVVNGKQVKLDAPAKIINGSTMVPLRFVGEALDQKIDWNGDTKQITIRPNSATIQSQPSQNSQGETTDDDLSYFYHTYKLEIPGVAFTNDYGTYSTLTISPGAVAGAITINNDGTWVWNSSWDGKVENGNWIRSNNSDYPILIQNGEDGEDWLVGKGTKDAQIIAWDKGKSVWKYGYQLK